MILSLLTMNGCHPVMVKVTASRDNNCSLLGWNVYIVEPLEQRSPPVPRQISGKGNQILWKYGYTSPGLQKVEIAPSPWVDAEQWGEI